MLIQQNSPLPGLPDNITCNRLPDYKLTAA